jgi:hypothetical protein
VADPNVADPIEALERRLDQLRAALRRAVSTGDRILARALRAELRQAEHAWDDALADIEDRVAAPVEVVGVSRLAGSMLSIREQVHHALTLLTVPAAPKLIIAVHDAFFPGDLVAARLTSLRRDEERSFRVSPFGRPYYLGPALTADLLAPARGLLAISTWPMETRVVGPLSPRVDFLISAIRVASRVATMPSTESAARRLMWRFAVSIPGATGGGAARSTTVHPTTIIETAQAELDIHAGADAADRAAAAERARDRLDDAERLFGARLQRLRGSAELRGVAELRGSAELRGVAN